MSFLKSLIAGFAGALALNILHETLRRLDPDAPRVDLLGEEALTKSLEGISVDPPQGDNLYLATLAGDLVTNTLYYSLIGGGKKKNQLLRGAYYGLTAGAGAVFMPKPLGLNEAPVARTPKTQLMTVTYYLFGAMVTAGALSLFNRNRS